MSRALGQRDAGGVVEDGGDLLVDLDELVGLDGDPLIARVDLGRHPLLEVPAGEGGQDVHDPLLGEAGPLLLIIREVSLQVRVAVDVGVDLLQPEALILGHVAVGHLVLLDVLLEAADDVLQKVWEKD